MSASTELTLTVCLAKYWSLASPLVRVRRAEGPTCSKIARDGHEYAEHRCRAPPRRPRCVGQRRARWSFTGEGGSAGAVGHDRDFHRLIGRDLLDGNAPSARPLQPSAPELLVQLPSLHVRPVVQGLPHAPQLVLLVLVSMQVPLHSVCPVIQAHLPLVQLWPPMHAALHAPQSSLLVMGSTQAPEHTTCPAGARAFSGAAVLTAVARGGAVATMRVVRLRVYAGRVAQCAAVGARALAGRAGLRVGAHDVARATVARVRLQIDAAAATRSEPRAAARGFGCTRALIFAQHVGRTGRRAIAAMHGIGARIRSTPLHRVWPA